MPHIPIVDPDAAAPEVNAVYEEFYRRMQFPSAPNFITVQGHSEASSRGIWELLKNVLLGGILPRWKKELIIVAVSRQRGCQYCIAAHTACCTMLGVNAEYMVRDVNRISDPILRDSILFAMKSARDPQSLTDSDFESLRRHGLSESVITELISVSALAVYLNIIADATAVEPDEMIKA
ncbi:MAG: carboxymuconolactone decarboxylase family protein [Xanthobacteraceae bacterium]